MSVRLRATLITAVFLALATIIMSALALSSQRANLTAESKLKIEVALSMLEEMSTVPLQEGDVLTLAGIADHAAKGRPSRVCIADRYGQILADSAHRGYDQTKPVIQSAMNARRQVIIRSGKYWEAAAPVIDHSGRLMGVVYTAFSTRSFDEALRRVSNTVFVFAVLSIIMGGVIAFAYGKRLSASFTPLLTAIRRTAAGGFGSTIPKSGVSELDEIGRAFNRMSVIVERRMSDLERLNQMAAELSTARTVDEFIASVDGVLGSLSGNDRKVMLGDPRSGVLRVAGEEETIAHVAPTSAASIAARERRAMSIGMKGDLAPGSSIIEGLSPDSAIVAPMVTPDEETVGVLIVTYDWREVPSPAKEDIANIAAMANLAAPSLAAIERSQTQEKGMEALREILTPDLPPESDWIEAHAVYEPAEKSSGIGGDYYDIIELGPETLGFAIGDVSGKGMDAGRYTAMAKYAVRSFALEGWSPSHTLIRAGAALDAQLDDVMFITIFFAALDVKTGRLRYSCAGHPPALLFSRNSGDVTELSIGGGAIGVGDPAGFTEGSVDVEPGDLLLLYTDGVIEAGPAEEQYGVDRLKNVLGHHGTKSLDSLSQIIVNDVRSHASGILKDDLALVLIRVKGRLEVRS
ncbi:MAG: SpoIIE family protein phosphatase [Armatimonadota bacterium]|nr:SpoIIE family protein phosphatase [Armatimonadota bacterium]